MSVINPGNINRIPPSMAAAPGVSRCTARMPVAGKGGAQTVEIAAPGAPEQQDAHDRGGDEQGGRPQPADQRGHQDEGQELRCGEREQPDKAPLNQGHRSNSCVLLSPISLVGATVGIVYGPADATTCAGGSAQASGSARSRAYILMREPTSASADFLSAGFPLIPWFRRHGCRERARRVRHLHHHLSGAGSVHLPAPAERARPAHGPGTAAL